eukprot:CAMPEP_0180187726 /NCGR_PEP_ID=MMETSP0986-20121125/43701_1 /TAXON_ID=697907 /ORGANISM="non described non described, Strain CCMP2293" /LENGTH=63 /DNA_ID=CAMNT_0022141877 /DNA_START=156 /DNA_END=344 /DNA_ORIENTATION=-
MSILNGTPARGNGTPSSKIDTVTSVASKGHSGRLHIRYLESHGKAGSLVTEFAKLSEKRHVQS